MRAGQVNVPDRDLLVTQEHLLGTRSRYLVRHLAARASSLKSLGYLMVDTSGTTGICLTSESKTRRDYASPSRL